MKVVECFLLASFPHDAIFQLQLLALQISFVHE